MFENLSERLSSSLRRIGGKASLTEANIQETLRELRIALLEADVALPVVKDFMATVKQRALGQEVARSLSPGQALIKIVQAELEALMGSANETLDLSTSPPAVVLMAGLQGVGKTTSAAKLARLLIERDKKKAMLVSVDVYRPAAIRQLQLLSEEVGADFFPSDQGQQPVQVATAAVARARINFCEVVIVDTAGRLAVDDRMMDEISALHSALQPVETLFVVDAMAGQDAATTARAFSDALPLTGVVLTKVDADSRGGAALSVRAVSGKPIKFLGVGETTGALDPFHPDRLASRILGMGDVLSLIEEAEQKVDRQQAERLARKVRKGKRFDLEDFRDQLRQLQNMGGVAGMLDKLPAMGGMAQAAQQQMDPRQVVVMEALINSMTVAERRRPELIQGSRKRRITRGSGTQVQDLNRLLKQHRRMQQMMKKMKGGGMQKMMRGMEGMMPPGPGGPPPGMFR